MEKRLVLLIVASIASVNSINVSTPLGDLIGRDNEDNSTSFFGVPYAAAPIGPQRFKPPVSPFRWDTPLDATKEVPACVQAGASGLQTSEDCLKLEIHVSGKTIDPNARMPVMVYIHGGGFATGSSAARGDWSKFVANSGIIVVSVQYRLGMLGFAQSPDDKIIPGNLGLKDQVAALKWVKEYIGFFGGNGLEITIAGQEAGGVSIAYHLVSPMSANLLQSAIIQSGSHLMIRLTGAVQDNVNKVISMTDCAKSTPEEQHECLRTVPLAQLQSIIDGGTVSFTPSMDSEFFANNDPIAMFAAGNFTNKLYSFIIGHNGNEGALYGLYLPQFFPQVEKPTPKKWPKPDVIATPVAADMQPKWQIIVDWSYEEEGELDEVQLPNALGEVMADFYVKCGIIEFIELYGRAFPDTGMYYYEFLASPANMSTRHQLPYIENALQGEELQYIYGKPLVDPTAYSQDEVSFSNQLITEWTTFVKTGSVADPSWPKIFMEQGEARYMYYIFADPKTRVEGIGLPGNFCQELR